MTTGSRQILSASRVDDKIEPATLRDLAEGPVRHQVDGVLAWCNRCAHNAGLPLVELLLRLGPAITVPLITRHLVCSSCGARDLAVRPG